MTTSTAQKLLYEVTAKKLLYAVKTLGVAEGVSLVADNLGFSLSQGQFMVILELFENPQTTDAQVFAFFKTLIDSSTVADAAAFSFARTRAEITTTADEQILAVFKLLLDAASATDAPAKTFGTARADAATAADDQLNHLNKHAVDTVNATDDVDAEASILDDQEMQFVKARSDTAAATESLSRQVGYNRTPADAASAIDLASLAAEKFFSDVGDISDAVLAAQGKGLSSSAGATDTFVHQNVFSRLLTDDGVISDTHAVTQSKAVSNATSVSDNVLLAKSKDITDTADATENNIFSVGKGLSNSAGATDTFTSQQAFSRSFTDTADATENNIFSIGKGLSNSAGATDTFTSQQAFSRSFTDTADATENNIFSVNKELSNSAGATDTFTSQQAFSRSFTDTAYATDDIDGAASILDDQEMQFVKARTDIASVTDSVLVLRTVNQSHTETPSATDAGSLRSQGFADFTYFAEDFVGASQTFT